MKRALTIGGSVVVLLSSGLGAGGNDAPAPAKTTKTDIHLSHEADVNKTEPDGTTALHRAVLASDLARVQKLIGAGAKVTARTRYGVTALSLAALNGNAAVVKALLKAGADPNTMAVEGEPVLMSAARTGDVDTVAALLDHGANPNTPENWQNQTALMWAAAENHPDVVRALLARGADPNAAASLLEYWAMAPAEPATPKVNTPKGGMAVLHYAARQGALDSVRVLASAPAIDLNRTDPDGVTAPIYATVNGHYDVAALLLEKGADVKLADQYGRTLLYSAIDMSRPEREPRPPARAKSSIGPLALAKLAIAKGADVNARVTGRIPTRCTNGCYQVGAEGATPLWRAARANDVEAVSLLLAAGADASIPAKDGSTPVMVAAGQIWREDHSVGTEQESIETIKALLAAGADINAANGAGETALHGAALRDSDVVVKFLVESGARLDVKDKANRMPLHTALGIGQIVKNGGGAPVDAPVRVKAEKMLRELMVGRGVPIEPYTRPEQSVARSQ